jgi:Zn-dependent M16 (insulinase) family peptidase
MSIDGSNNVTTFETDMRDVLRTRNARLPNVTRQPGNDYADLMSGISVQSIQEIDRLIAGLEGVREKLNSDGDRLHREIAQYGAFSQSVVELTKIVSDAMASVNKS